MIKKSFKGNLILLLAAMIWGSAFIAQSKGMDFTEPFTFNGIRTLLGGLVLLPFCLFRNKKTAVFSRATVEGGVLCGIVLFIASSLQQYSLVYTSASKAGFITTLYVLMVPLIAFILGRNSDKTIFIWGGIAVVGFFLISLSGDFSLQRGDFLAFIAAIFFSMHIITVDRYMDRGADSIGVSCIQLFVCAVFSLPAMLIFEHPDINAILSVKWELLYVGCISSGLAYTLQIVGQKYADPSIATMIMSLESVFCAFFGYLILGEKLTLRELLGCVIVFAAVICAQIPKKKKDTHKDNTDDENTIDKPSLNC